jgi:hypothetical protein
VVVGDPIAPALLRRLFPYLGMHVDHSKIVIMAQAYGAEFGVRQTCLVFCLVCSFALSRAVAAAFLATALLPSCALPAPPLRNVVVSFARGHDACLSWLGLMPTSHAGRVRFRDVGRAARHRVSRRNLGQVRSLVLLLCFPCSPLSARHCALPFVQIASLAAAVFVFGAGCAE